MHMLWHALEIVKQKGIIDTIEYFFFSEWCQTCFLNDECYNVLNYRI